MRSDSKEGVGILIEESYKKKVIEREPVNSTEMEKKILLIQIYAPTQDMEEFEKEFFYTTLQETFNKMKNCVKHVIIMGDWNAKIGNSTKRDRGTVECT